MHVLGKDCFPNALKLQKLFQYTKKRQKQSYQLPPNFVTLAIWQNLCKNNLQQE